jgi:hypothetical protein
MTAHWTARSWMCSLVREYVFDAAMTSLTKEKTPHSTRSPKIVKKARHFARRTFSVRTGSANYSAASFNFFSGRTFTLTDAGLAANHCSAPVNGFLPKRFLVAGT